MTIHRVPTCRCGHPESPEHDGGSCRICGCPGFHKRRHGAVEVTTGVDPLDSKAREQLLEIAKTVERAATVLAKTAADMVAAFGMRTARRRQQATNGAVATPQRRPIDRLPRGHRRILLALARYGECSKAKLAILARYAANGGGFNNYLSALRAEGLLVGTDPYSITPAGQAALGYYEPMPEDPDDLFKDWMQHPELGRAHRSILHVLRQHGRSMTKESVAFECGYEPNGGGFNNAVSRLRTLGLVDGKNEIRLAEQLR